MTERKAVFNPQAASSKKSSKKKRVKEKKSPKLKSKKEESNTRTIRFAPRTAQSIVSFVFFGFFFVMCVVLLMTYGRVDTLSRIAASKQVNKEELVLNVNNSLKNTEQLRYEGTKLTDCLFTFSPKEDGKKKWDEQITPYLASGLNPSDLGFSSTSVERVSKSVRFIKMETVNEKESIYQLYYDVQFTEGDTWQQVQIILPVSYEGQEMKLLERPAFTNLSQTDEKNPSIYQEFRFLPVGTEVKDEELNKVIEFTQRFFELYVTDDEKLALVANVKGLGKAKLIQAETKKVIKTEEGHYYVQGTYTFVFNENNPLTSNFTLEIKATNESYFVTKMNGE